MTRFDDAVRDHFQAAFRIDPLAATDAGVHDHDDRWPDLSEAGRRSRLTWLAGEIGRFAGLAAETLPADAVIDRDRLVGVLDDERFALDEARDDAWDPLSWVHLLGTGLFPLIALDFAPPAARLRSLAGRLSRLDGVVDAAVEQLGSVPGLPVSRLHTERAITDLPGIGALIDQAVELAAAHAGEPGVDGLRPVLDAAAASAHVAVDRLRDHLETAIRPVAVGEGRLGPQRYAAKLPRTLGDPAMTPDRVLAAAESEVGQVRAEMARIAADLWPSLRPGEAPPADADALTRGVLDRIADDHAAPDELLDVCRAALARIEAFCREHEIITLAEEPLEIAWTPVYLRGWAQAMLVSPGPFDVGQRSFFNITPVPDDWAPELRESWLRETHRRQLEVITIHEAVPGHYLQGVYGNRAPSLVRSVHGDGTFAEGWAVYVTQVMIDAGYGAADPALVLTHWKYYLRAAINAILDIRIHTRGMTEAEALDLMVRGGFQEEGEARAKYERARLTSTQLCSYFVGSMGLWELEHEVRRRAAIAAGDPRGADAVPPTSITGGHPPTPGFDRRSHLEGLISHGKLPLPLLRRVVLG